MRFEQVVDSTVAPVCFSEPCIESTLTLLSGTDFHPSVEPRAKALGCFLWLKWDLDKSEFNQGDWFLKEKKTKAKVMKWRCFKDRKNESRALILIIVFFPLFFLSNSPIT